MSESRGKEFGDVFQDPPPSSGRSALRSWPGLLVPLRSRGISLRLDSELCFKPANDGFTTTSASPGRVASLKVIGESFQREDQCGWTFLSGAQRAKCGPLRCAPCENAG